MVCLGRSSVVVVMAGAKVTTNSGKIAKLG